MITLKSIFQIVLIIKRRFICLQDADMPLSYAFEVIEWTSLKWIIGVGAVFGMCAW